MTGYMDELSLALNDAKSSVTTDAPFEVWICPTGAELPQDDFLTYTTVDSYFDICARVVDSTQEGAEIVVVVVREDQAKYVRVLCEGADVIGLRVRALHGVPSSTYEPWFDDCTFGAERIAYGPLYEEWRVSVDVENLRAANTPKDDYSRERAQFVRANGSVKELPSDRVIVGLGDADSGGAVYEE